MYANGHQIAKETHISVYAYLMKGEYDSVLDWPFEGDIIMELINWREDKNHLSHTIVFNHNTDPEHSSRVTEDDISQHGWDGHHDAFPHSSLLYNPVSIFMMTVSGLELEKYACTSSSCDLSLSQYSELAVRILQVKFLVTAMCLSLFIQEDFLI